MRRTIFERLMESASRCAMLPSADAGGTTIVSDAGGGGSAASPPSSPAGGGDGGGSSGSPTPAPAATPSTSPSSPEPSSAPSPASSPEATPDPWAGLGLDPEDSDEIAIPAQPAAPAPAAPAAPAAPQPPVPPQQPAPAPAQPEPPAQQPAPAQPPAASMPSPAEPAALAEFMLSPQNRQAILDHISKEKYALNDQEVTELSEDAVQAVPKLLAKAHLEITASVMRFMQQSIPQLISQHTKVTDANKRAETQFFGAVKGLDANNAAHRKAASDVVRMYRQMNPDATMEQVIQICAPMVLNAVGAQAAATPPTAGAPPAAPQPPLVQVPAAFQPALGGTGAQPAPADTNPWMGLGGTYDED